MNYIFSLYDGTNLSSNENKRIINTNTNKNRILTIVKENGIGLSRSLMKIIELVHGLWIYPSFFNHSCLPNLFYYGIGDCLIAIAQQDIKENEELTINYISCEYEYTTRTKNILMTWKFECKCPLCIYEKEALINYLKNQ